MTTSLKDYTCIKVLGAGNFGRVEKCQEIKKQAENPEKFVAIKFIHIDKENGQKKIFQEEVNQLNKLPDSPHLTRYISSFNDGDQYIIIMEFIEGHTLLYYTDKLTRQKINRPKPMVMFLLMKTAFQGLDILHSNKILHRDIKFDNIMIRGAKVVNRELTLDPSLQPGSVLVDFGLSCTTDILSKDNNICKIAIHGFELFQHPNLIELIKEKNRMVKGRRKKKYTAEEKVEMFEKMRGADIWALMYTFLGLSVNAYPLPYGKNVSAIPSGQKEDSLLTISFSTAKWIENSLKLKESHFLYKNDSGIDSCMKDVILQKTLPGKYTAKNVVESLTNSGVQSAGDKRMPNMTVMFDVEKFQKDVKRVLAGVVVGGVVGGAVFLLAKNISKKIKKRKEAEKKKQAEAKAKAEAEAMAKAKAEANAGKKKNKSKKK